MRSSKRVALKQTIWQKPGTWVVILLILLAGGGGWYYLQTPGAAAISWNPFARPAAEATPSYYTTTVRQGNIQISASGAGTLVANQSVDLNFSTGGSVTELNVKLGDPVKSGQVLAKLGNAAALQANVASAELAVVQAQQALDTLQQNAQPSLAQAFQTVITSQQKYNDTLTADQHTSYARCSKPVNTSNAEKLANAAQKLTDLTQSSYGSDSWIAAQGAYDTALANYNYCIAYTPDEKTSASSALNIAKVNLQQAQQTYNALKTANGVDPNQLALDQAKLNQAQSQLDQAKKDMAGITLVAPMNGTVTYLAASQGGMVDTSKFITISDASHPTLQVSVDETDLSKLKLDSTVDVTFDALPEQVFTGKVTQVQPALVTSGNTQVAQGSAELDENAAKVLKNLPLGLNASVTVIDQQAKNVLLVPVQALRDLGGGQYGVFVQGRDGQLQLKIVQVGLTDTVHAQILSGLNAGDVISTGAAQVR
jgi:HlyD family secretion protein